MPSSACATALESRMQAAADAPQLLALVRQEVRVSEAAYLTAATRLRRQTS